MKRSDQNIGEMLKVELQQCNSPISFDSVWNKYEMKNIKHFGLRKTMLVPIVVLLTVFTMVFASYGIIKTVDNIDYPFVDDQRVIGKWESVDFVEKIEDFRPYKKACTEELYLTALAFINGGDMLIRIEGGELYNGTSTWTKGLILNKISQTASKYELKEIDGETYMFKEWKSGDYTDRNMVPQYYVLRKVDSLKYTNIGEPRVEDKTDFPFENDPEVLGSWQSVDFIEAVDDFKPGIKSWGGDLNLAQVDMLKNGKLGARMASGKAPKYILSWTKGRILDKWSKTAAKYEIRELDGTEYLFYEWKSGDYLYGKVEPWYYVLKRIK